MTTSNARPNREIARQIIAACHRKQHACHSAHQLAGSTKYRPRLEEARRIIAQTKGSSHFAFKRGNDLHLFLEGPIGVSDKKGNCVRAAPVISTLKSYPNLQEIYVNINSIGGYLDEAYAIHEALLDHPANVTTIAGKMCYSAATIILMAGDRREASPDSKILLHSIESLPREDPISSRWTSDRYQAMATVLAEGDKRLVELYTNRIGGSRNFIEKELKNESYIPLVTCEWHGLIHGLVGGGSTFDSLDYQNQRA